MRTHNVSGKNIRGIHKAVILAGLSATNAFAFIAPTQLPVGVKVKSAVVRPSTYKSDVSAFDASDAIVTLDRQSNAIRHMSGTNLLDVAVQVINAKNLEKAALEAIAKNPDIFGVAVSDVRVIANATLADAIDQSVSFSVYRHGVRIQDAGITLRFKKGNLASLTSETYSEATVAEGHVGQTGEIAAKALNSHGYLSRGSSYRVQPTSAGYSLVKVDEFVVAGADAAWVVQVNTTNGEIFELRSKNFQLRGRAEATVYPRYFGEQLQATGLAFSEVANASARSNETGEFQTVDSFSVPKMTGFSGQFVTVKNLAGEELTASGSKIDNEWQLKFNIEPSEVLWDNNDMAAAMVYINANRVIKQAQKYIQPAWFNQPLKANVNHDEHCNAYWTSEEQSINFFTAGKAGSTTCANTALISDVIFHEWGHGLDDNTGGIDDGALSEGFGDAVALLFTEDSKVGIDFKPLEHKPVRDMSVLKVYPKDVVGQVHSDGLIIGGTWFDLFSALKQAHGSAKAKDLYSKYLFKGIYAAKKMSDVYAATLTIDDNDGNLANKTPNFCLINAAFSRHGLATKDSSCQ